MLIGVYDRLTVHPSYSASLFTCHLWVLLFFDHSCLTLLTLVSSMKSVFRLQLYLGSVLLGVFEQRGRPSGISCRIWTLRAVLASNKTLLQLEQLCLPILLLQILNICSQSIGPVLFVVYPSILFLSPVVTSASENVRFFFIPLTLTLDFFQDLDVQPSKVERGICSCFAKVLMFEKTLFL